MDKTYGDIMHFKSILLGSILATSTLPLAANAALETYNYTNEESSVRVTSGIIKPCSLDAGVYTPKMNPDGTPGRSSVNDTEINILCKTSTNTCTADIYNTKNCTGDKIGYATLSLATKTVISFTTLDPRYVIDVQNGTILTLRYSK